MKCSKEPVILLFEAKVKYGYDHFNRGEENFGPWHLFSFDLSKKLKWGTVIGRINYANRNFSSISKSGPQFEIDLYPRISKGFYAYVNGGYSSSSVFPKYRFGGELYKSLPSGFEISAGARYLDFSTANVLIYTGNLGKYYKNYWFSLRPFITSKTSGIDISGILLIRKYQNNPRNYISLLLGIGSSPIELFFLEDIERLNSYKIGIEIVQMVSRSTLIEIQIRYEREEFQLGKFGNRYTLNFSFLQIFFKKY
jgi:YaiO family outer membrane protein